MISREPAGAVPFTQAKLRLPFKLAQAYPFVSRSSSSRWQAWLGWFGVADGLVQ